MHCEIKTVGKDEVDEKIITLQKEIFDSFCELTWGYGKLEYKEDESDIFMSALVSALARFCGKTIAFHENLEKGNLTKAFIRAVEKNIVEFKKSNSR